MKNIKYRVNNLNDVESFLYACIPRGGKSFPGELGLKRIKKFLKLLDNPQNKIKIIHIAGTSGKSSTAYYISLILNSQNFKTGLMLSPHIINFRERFQINNHLLEQKEIISYFNQILPYIHKFNQSHSSSLSYFEILVSLGFYIFYKEKVDYAVIETGLGGLYDGTNCIENKNKTVVLTKIGFDHKEILGNTISKIAYQKAKIITPKNYVISADQSPSAKKIIKKIAKENSAPLAFVKNKVNYKIKNQTDKFLTFNFFFKNLAINNIRLNTPALYQAENCSMALATAEELAKKNNFFLDADKIIKKLIKANFQGRMEALLYKGKTIILDCAHNPQKMTALIKSLTSAFPNKKMTFITSFKRGKDYRKMINCLMPLATKIYLTNFNCRNQDSLLKSESTDNISKYLLKKKKTHWQIIEDPVTAVKKALKNKTEILIITGSLYLVSSVYGFLKK